MSDPSILELARELGDLRAKNTDLERDLSLARSAMESQREALARLNPNQLTSLERARTEASTILSQLLPLLNESHELHRLTVDWLDQHANRLAALT